MNKDLFKEYHNQVFDVMTEHEKNIYVSYSFYTVLARISPSGGGGLVPECDWCLYFLIFSFCCGTCASVVGIDMPWWFPDIVSCCDYSCGNASSYEKVPILARAVVCFYEKCCGTCCGGSCD